MRYLISGGYGQGNAGDEAILAGMLQEIRRRDPHAEFTVLSFDPADTERRHGVEGDLATLPTSLRSPARLRAAMRSADLLISGGGSFLHEADFELHGRSFLFRDSKLRPVPYFLSIVLMARAADLSVMWYAQGLGPLHTRAARRMVAAAGSASQVVTWRDPDSARLAYEVGVRAPIQLVVPDPAYALAPAPQGDAAALLTDLGIAPGTRYMTVCPRPWLGRTAFLANLGGALEKASSLADLEVLFVPFHELQDLSVCEALAARPGFAGRAHVLPPEQSPAVLAAVLGGSQVAVTMRLHGGILAATAGSPAVVIDYDPKTMAFAASTGQSAWTVSVDHLENGGVRSDAAEASLVHAILDTLSHLDHRRAALRRAVTPFREDAGRTARLAVQLAASGPRSRPDTDKVARV